MKKLLMVVIPVIIAAGCSEPAPVMCTQEFRMITVVVNSPGQQPVMLDSSYTLRLPTNEVIRPQQQMGEGTYVILDDAYHARLRNAEADFRFMGWKGNQLVVDQVYRIAGDDCHIFKKSGADTVLVQ